MNEHTLHATRRLPEVGDQILCRGQLVFVTAVRTHEPGHGMKPIRDDWGFIEWVTSNGSRYAGVNPETNEPAYLPLVEPRS